jgi:hypothetical protein
LWTGAHRRGRGRRPELQLVCGRGGRPQRADARREGLAARNGDARAMPSSCPSPREVGARAAPSCRPSTGRVCGRDELLLVAVAGSSCGPSSSPPSLVLPIWRATGLAGKDTSKAELAGATQRPDLPRQVGAAVGPKRHRSICVPVRCDGITDATQVRAPAERPGVARRPELVGTVLHDCS